jgi:SAM-dependent methyltransferase
MLDLLPGAVRIGIDPNEHARAEAARRGARVEDSASRLQAECVDVVISNHALEHTLNPWGELRGRDRVLKAGGKLVFWLPMDDWGSQRTRAGPDPDHHLYAWTPQSLSNLVTEAGSSSKKPISMRGRGSREGSCCFLGCPARPSIGFAAFSQSRSGDASCSLWHERRSNRR